MRYEIDEIRRVLLNGLKQKIHIRGMRRRNPLLLVLHGGPGVPNRAGIMQNHAELAEHFTVVAWDQRGTGGSYKGAAPETMTMAHLQQDILELCTLLLHEFGQKKLFIMGGSWGTELGIYFVYDHPELVYAYLGYGQVVDGFLNEELSYRFVMKEAEKAGKTEDIKALQEIGPPMEGCYRPVFEGLMKHRSLLSKYGGSSVVKGSMWEKTVKPILLSEEYTLGDKWGIIKGYKFSLMHLWQEIVRYHFIEEKTSFAVPIYIFQGRLDNNTPSSLVEEYFRAISAPHKELIWFEHSAHGPLSEEKERFHRLMLEKLLPYAEGEEK